MKCETALFTMVAYIDRHMIIVPNKDGVWQISHTLYILDPIIEKLLG